ncbi:putative CFEM domain-containing [Seiridium cardinale]|uniref:CFEM domain-containing n=1 Tax=Seiridium cardinale TaxID=138064 RepID=A0ABR2XXT9_9PEZI
MKALQSLPALTLINFPFLYSLLFATAAAEGIDATTTTSTSCKPWRWTVTTIDSVSTTIDLPGHAPDYTPVPRKEIRLATSTAACEASTVGIDKFFMLNPELDSDCGNIAPETEYCVGLRTAALGSATRAPAGETGSYSTDGTCGSDHGMRKCAGNWGDCCSFKGKCGTSEDFFGVGVCQSGDCTLCQGGSSQSVGGSSASSTQGISSGTGTIVREL